MNYSKEHKTDGNVYLHSPLSEETITKKQYQPLLVQFLLKEMLSAIGKAAQKPTYASLLSGPARFFPYDSCMALGCLNKIEEHAELLGAGFAHLQKQELSFSTQLAFLQKLLATNRKRNNPFPKREFIRAIKKLAVCLFPYLKECRQDEGLIFFLLNHKSQLATLLGKRGWRVCFPDGEEESLSFMKTQFAKRGFTSLTAQMDQLITIHGQ